MLTIIVCVMLVTVATSFIAQTVVLLRMGRESAVRQQRIEQLMLNQEATARFLLRYRFGQHQHRSAR